MILDWHAIKEALADAVYERAQDLVYFLIILAIVFLTLWNVYDVFGDPARTYRGLTEHHRQVRLAAEVADGRH